jgi:hypothetical protein
LDTDILTRYPIGFKNTGNTTLQYAVGHIPAGTALTYNTSIALPNEGPVPLSGNAASLSFNKSEFLLAPGASTKITVTVTPPAGLDPASFPIYSGWVTVTADNGEILVVPYMGLAANLIDMDVLDRSDYYFGFPTPVTLDATGATQTDPTNYTFAGTDFPSFLWRQAAGSPKVVLNLVEATANDTQAPTIGTLLEDEYTPRNSAIGVSAFGSVDDLTNDTSEQRNRLQSHSMECQHVLERHKGGRWDLQSAVEGVEDHR